MAITGTKLFASGDVLTANDTNQYLMRGVKVFSSTAVRDAAYGGAGEPTLEEGETCYITAIDKVQAYNGSSWIDIGPSTIPYADASGGTETAITADSVAYTLHTFNSSANLTVSTAGYLDILCVGGGGGTQTSFAGNTRAGGGGGGEIKLAYRFYAPAGTYGIVVGAGGASGGLPGGRSYVKFYLSDIEFNVAFGGGGGSGGGLGYVGYWHGGSGGGGGGYGGANAGGPAQGDNTRKGGTAVSDSSGGGGGGAAADGGNASGGTGGAGGAGLDISLFLGQSATTTYKAGGGGGQGLSVNGTSGAGTGSANTGGGGVGGNNAGWSGIVYVRSLG